MSNANSPLNQAHNHALNAEDFATRGLLIPAAEEHYKAAEAFQTCVEQCDDEVTKRTLRMLYADHSKAGKELQRRIEKLKEQGKDPNAPQIPSAKTPTTSRIPDFGKEKTLPNPLPQHRMNDSPSNTVDESFMVLNRQAEQSDDPFDMFWKVTEEMMVNLSQPISFPSAALAAFNAVDNQPDPKPTNTVHLVKAHIKPSSSHPPRKGSVIAVDEDFVDDEDYDSADSFCMVDSNSTEAATTTLRKENATLKAQLETVQKQVMSVQRQMSLKMEQDQQLRDRIATARREAHRALAASATFATRPGSMMLDIANLNLGAPLAPPSPVPALTPGGRDSQAQLLRRIRELEEELRTTRSENEKQKVMIAKFRERWERLKESAKRKRSAKAATQGDRPDRIDEVPEVEEEEEKTTVVTGDLI